MTEPRRSVFVIDDSDLSLAIVGDALESAGYHAKTFSSVFDVASEIDAHKPAAIIVDLMMPALGGDKVVDVLRRNNEHHCPIFLYSSAPESELRMRAMACGADGYAQKSHDLGPLVRLVMQKAGGSW